MGDAERPRDAALVTVDEIDPAHPDASHCLTEYFAELDRRFHTGFDPARSRLPDPDEMRPPAGVFLVARREGRPVGCGGLKFHDDSPTEIKRMWVDPSARGIGLGRRLLDELEQRAAAHGDHLVRLDTNSTLTEAIAMYTASGYRRVDAFNAEAYADHWFEKQL
jgi:GNAT superfamily N-acetyltransferase